MIDSFVTYSGQEAFAATLAALRSSEMINECFVRSPCGYFNSGRLPTGIVTTFGIT